MTDTGTGAPAATPAQVAPSQAPAGQSSPSGPVAPDMGSAEGRRAASEAAQAAYDARPGGGLRASYESDYFERQDAAPEPPVQQQPQPAQQQQPQQRSDTPQQAPAEGAQQPAEAQRPEWQQPGALEQTRVYDAFRVPEGMSLDNEQVSTFTGLLENREQLGHQERGQRLIDMHIAEVGRVRDAMAKHQMDVWRQYNDQQVATLKADPEIGGTRLDASLGEAKRLIEDFGGSREQVQELVNQLTHTGMGNSAPLVRLLVNLHKQLGEGTPVQSGLPGAGKRTWAQKAYGA